jgi:hypothetical protein
MAIKAELMGFVHEINRAGRVARSVSSHADANSSLQMLCVEATPNKEQPPLTCGNRVRVWLSPRQAVLQLCDRRWC